MKKFVKKITAVVLSAVLVAGCFAGCSANKAKYTVGVCQLVQHEALDAATEGFQKALKDKLGDDVKVVVQNAANDPTTCATITNQFVSDGVDLIMANATPALQSAMQSTTTIPIVATSITSYAVALDIPLDEWTGKTGINVTGTSDLAPLEEQAKMVNDLTGAKKVGILYCSGEPNSVYQAKVVGDELKTYGIESKEYTVADSNDIATVTQTACDECDALYIPTDNVMAAAVGTIDPIAKKANKPIIAGEEGILKGCGVASLTITYYDIGYKAGEMAADILVNGTNPGDMEIAYAPTTKKKYSPSRATACGITIPEEYESVEE